jgi:23S rRNA pseudouridine2605 synthase
MIKEGEQNDWFSITIHEGRNRQVRRMCEAVSLSVVRLRRVRYGTLSLGALKPGEFRMLTEAEVSGLRNPHHSQDAAAAKAPARSRPASSTRITQRTATATTTSQSTSAGKRPSPSNKNRSPRKP